MEYGINLGEAIILLTANYAEKVPDFVRSRCKFVNIQLLSFKERLNILQIRRDMLIREYFPAPRYAWESEEANTSEIDKYNQRHSRIAPLVITSSGVVTSDYNNGTIYLTDEQEEIKAIITDEFLKLSITETFGIREGIMNLMSVIDFLVKAKVRGVLNRIADPSTIISTDSNQPNYREIITNPDGSGLINFYYADILDGNGDRQPLTIMKKRDVEVKKEKQEEKGRKESVINMVKD